MLAEAATTAKLLIVPGRVNSFKRNKSSGQNIPIRATPAGHLLVARKKQTTPGGTRRRGLQLSDRALTVLQSPERASLHGVKISPYLMS